MILDTKLRLQVLENKANRFKVHTLLSRTTAPEDGGEQYLIAMVKEEGVWKFDSIELDYTEFNISEVEVKHFFKAMGRPVKNLYKTTYESYLSIAENPQDYWAYKGPIYILELENFVDEDSSDDYSGQNAFKTKYYIFQINDGYSFPMLETEFQQWISLNKVKMDAEIEGIPTDDEVRKITEKSYKLFGTIKAFGEQGWETGGAVQPQWEPFAKALQPYFSINYLNQAKEYLDDYFVATEYILPTEFEFDKHFVIQSRTPDEFTAEAYHSGFEGEESVIFIVSAKKENGAWKIDKIDREVFKEERKSVSNNGEIETAQISKDQAVHMVRTYLQTHNSQIPEDLIIEFSRMQDDYYLFHVYNNIDNEYVNFDSTWGWYGVHQKTGEIVETTAYSYSNNQEAAVNNSPDSREAYLAKLDNIKIQERESSTGVTTDIENDNNYNYKLWDNALDEIYSVLKNKLSESEMNDLRDKQRQWITYRDQAAKESYNQEGGGSVSDIVYGETLVKVTRERCYELVKLYMK